MDMQRSIRKSESGINPDIPGQPYCVSVLKEGYCTAQPDGSFKADGTISLITGPNTVLVDTGGPWDRDFLVARLKEKGLTPDSVALVVGTHGHSDHVGNLGLFPDAKIIVGCDISVGDRYLPNQLAEGQPYPIDDFPDDLTIAARISDCLVDISCWMKEHHLQLNLAKTDILDVPASSATKHNFQLDALTIKSSRTAKNLGVLFDDRLDFTNHIAKTARSCRFALYNIRKIRPFLSEHDTQLLVQPLDISRLDYCNALLAGLPACKVKPLQLIQIPEHGGAHVKPLFISLHWLPVKNLNPFFHHYLSPSPLLVPL
ncbi:uncharacterized protein mblac1 isoform X3 [Myxocyprinus asiaticus]|uniref:uncharacterized protein mblac1 isoform X3 n=1 Tax=Myxocyprinus asiaticus TaxID=70543 RepID=UPI002223624A|nr:uncharacterized protein mblac1 isoform X3 [Myxocyprinus asiaticus]